MVGVPERGRDGVADGAGAGAAATGGAAAGGAGAGGAPAGAPGSRNGADGFSIFASVLGSGSSFTSGRWLGAGGAGVATGSGDAAIGSDGVVTDAGRSHQTSTAARRTAFSTSAASRRPDV
jgi:hypothetical protein